MMTQVQTGRSAEVQMRLLLNGYTFSITHMGSDFLRLKDAVEHPPAAAEVILTIDGHESRWNVFLPEGLRPGEIRVPVNRAE